MSQPAHLRLVKPAKQTHFTVPRPEPNRPEVERAISYSMISRCEDNGAKAFSRWRRTHYLIGDGWNLGTVVKLSLAVLVATLILGQLVAWIR